MTGGGTASGPASGTPGGRLRILHVVTLVSDDGAFGGPVSVATGHLDELSRRGHQVLLLSLWRGAGRAPARFEGVPLHTRRARTLIPGFGFLGLFHPLLLVDLWREAGRADVVHVHAGRDLVSLAALTVARIRRRPYLAQTHGMVQPRTKAVARVFDKLFVPLLRRARTCFMLTGIEEAGFVQVVGDPPARIRILPNGVRVSESEPGQPSKDPDGHPEVVFAARLHPRKRPEAFVEAAAKVHAELPQVRFTLYGADEGCLPGVLELIERLGLAGVVRHGGAVDHSTAVQRTAEAAVNVLPSVNEPFPMGMLEALGVGTPSVCTWSSGISEELAARGAALVTDGSPEQLADAVVSLLTDETLRARTIEAGHRAVREVYSLPAVVDRLEAAYRDARRR